jgi:hypothetical protein
MTNVNWKLLAERSGMKISVLRKALKNSNGRPKKLLLRALAMPTDGRDSHNYTRYHHPNFDFDDIVVDDSQSMWDHCEEAWSFNVDGTKRWRSRDVP